MEVEINESVLNYLEFILNKKDINSNDLLKVKKIAFNPVSISNDYEEIDLSILSVLNNLEEVTFKNMFIHNKDIITLSKIKSLHSITFEKCEFEEELILDILNLTSLSFVDSDIRDLTFVYNMINLNRLTIIEDNIIIGGINKLTNLKYLNISASLIEDKEKLNLENLEYLDISYLYIDSYDFLNNLKSLKYLVVDKNQYENNISIINNLIKNNVIVMNEASIVYGGGLNG